MDVCIYILIYRLYIIYFFKVNNALYCITSFQNYQNEKFTTFDRVVLCDGILLCINEEVSGCYYFISVCFQCLFLTMFLKVQSFQ